MKTTQQAREGFTKLSPLEAGRRIFAAEGVRGLYRGGTPLVVGGALMRSAQFGVYENALELLTALKPKPDDYAPAYVVDPWVAAAGFCGGVGRGVVEAPFEFVKVRRQVDRPWKLAEVYRGSAVTVVRNAGLFTAFACYMDFTKRALGQDVSPFVLGALAANGAWLTIWPLDVVKSRVQSGRYEGGWTKQLSEVVRTGVLFRGLLPGLLRSTIANGASMTVFVWVKNALAPVVETHA